MFSEHVHWLHHGYTRVISWLYHGYIMLYPRPPGCFRILLVGSQYFPRFRPPGVGTALVALLALRRGPQPWLDELPRDYAAGLSMAVFRGKTLRHGELADVAMILPIILERCTELHHVFVFEDLTLRKRGHVAKKDEDLIDTP